MFQPEISSLGNININRNISCIELHRRMGNHKFAFQPCFLLLFSWTSENKEGGYLFIAGLNEMRLRCLRLCMWNSSLLLPHSGIWSWHMFLKDFSFDTSACQLENAKTTSPTWLFVLGLQEVFQIRTLWADAISQVCLPKKKWKIRLRRNKVKKRKVFSCAV